MEGSTVWTQMRKLKIMKIKFTENLLNSLFELNRKQMTEQMN